MHRVRLEGEANAGIEEEEEGDMCRGGVGSFVRRGSVTWVSVSPAIIWGQMIGGGT